MVGVNVDGAPPGALADMIVALDVLSAASGLSLVFAGTTSEEPSEAWMSQPRPPQNEPLDVLVGWVSPDGDLIDPGVAGRTYTAWEGAEFTRAMVVLHEGLDVARPAGHGIAGGRGAVYLHELGHVVGLAHVPDPDQLMYPDTSGGGSLGDGDLAGLEQLRGLCR